MKFEQIFCMVGGDGESSYAKNSRIQEKAILKAKPLAEEAIREIYNTLHPEKLVVADLGCSSGPNTFHVLSQIINVVDEHCRQSNQSKPEILFFLNDLPSNDFNSLFQLLMPFEKQMREEKDGDEFVPFYVAGLPGSFYGRLFPSKSVHFFHSSYCLMWLSQVPQGLKGENGARLNRGNIYINKESSSIVSHLYLEQFKLDFSEFLESRSKELILGGKMILSFLGSRSCPYIGGHLHFWGLLAEALNDMVYELQPGDHLCGCYFNSDTTFAGGRTMSDRAESRRQNAGETSTPGQDEPDPGMTFKLEHTIQLSGVVEEAKLNTFNLPFYTPLLEEVKSTIELEGSFYLYEVQTFESNWDPFDESTENFVEDKNLSGKNIAKYVRAIIEPLLASHFGNEIIEDLFSRYAKNITRHMCAGKPKYIVFILLLKLKENLM